MNTKKIIYNFNPINKAFLNESQAPLDKLESKKQKKDIFRIPRGATTVKPPEANNGEIQVFNGKSWDVVADTRSKVLYNLETGESSSNHNVIGAAPEGYSFEKPEIKKSWDDIRLMRNSLLSASDWTQLADSPLSDKDKKSWVDYRRSLRDLTDKYKDPDIVKFPEEPK